MVSRLMKSAAIALAATSVATVASAGCGSSMYCGSTGASSTLPALSTWSSDNGASYTSGHMSHHGANHGSASYTSSVSSYSYGSGYGGVMSDSAASAAYGSGSISDTYTGGDVQMYGFSGGMSGLGANESLQATNCPTNVYGAPNGSRVLGCYNVVKQVPQTNYVRVVRPIIYVRYPVPVAVPTYSACNTVVTHHSRYGGYGPNGAYRSRCGW